MEELHRVLDWLAEGAPSAPRSEDVLAELCPRLVGCGVPLARAAVFVMTLHPQFMGRSFVWRQGAAAVDIRSAPFDVLESRDYHSNPIFAVRQSRRPLRRRLTEPRSSPDFPLLDELHAEGVTDYVAHPLLFGDGSVHVATWSTAAPEGFTEAQLAAIASVIPPLTRVAEIRALRRNAGNLLDAYVGHQAGERILAGEIRRGHVEEITAAIWLSDMRGFTARAERMPAQALIDLLNRFFDCQVPAITGHGGEILKFMGDGLLAIFPVEPGTDPKSVCQHALAAARAAQSALAALTPSEPGADPVKFAVALHLGHLMYGNIGGGERLDFTCIGPAVNLAARLERIAARLDQPIVTSAEFAAHVPGALRLLGEFPAAGFSGLQPVFGLAAPS